MFTKIEKTPSKQADGKKFHLEVDRDTHAFLLFVAADTGRTLKEVTVSILTDACKAYGKQFNVPFPIKIEKLY